MTRLDLKKKAPARPQRSDRSSFWDGALFFAFFEGVGDLIGAIFDGLGSN